MLDRVKVGFLMYLRATGNENFAPFARWVELVYLERSCVSRYSGIEACELVENVPAWETESLGIHVC